MKIPNILLENETCPSVFIHSRTQLTAHKLSAHSHHPAAAAASARFAPPRTAATHGSSRAQDGVLLIGEHGDYGWNEKDQHLYPRKYFMEAITGWMSTAGKPVPVFCDKHLSCTHS